MHPAPRSSRSKFPCRPETSHRDRPVDGRGPARQSGSGHVRPRRRPTGGAGPLDARRLTPYEDTNSEKQHIRE